MVSMPTVVPSPSMVLRLLLRMSSRIIKPLLEFIFLGLRAMQFLLIMGDFIPRVIEIIARFFHVLMPAVLAYLITCQY
jgi:hypothetical protein